MNSPRPSRRKIVKLLCLFLLVSAILAGIFLAGNRIDAQAMEGLVRKAGPWGPIAYIALYFVAPLFLLPGSPLTIASGVLFGPIWGTLYTIIGATGGACLSFLAARYLGADWVERKAWGKLGRIKAGIEKEGWKFVVLLRLVPVVPFNLLNILLGLTRIRLSVFAVTSFFAMLPGTAAYVYLGHAGKQAAEGGAGFVRTALIALALLALVSVLPTMVKKRQENTL